MSGCVVSVLRSFATHEHLPGTTESCLSPELKCPLAELHVISLAQLIYALSCCSPLSAPSTDSTNDSVPTAHSVRAPELFFPRDHAPIGSPLARWSIWPHPQL